MKIRLCTNLGLPAVDVDLSTEVAYVGRKSGDLLINRAEVSGRHLSIECCEEGVVMSDLGSANGSYFCGSRAAITQRTPVLPRVPIYLGSEKLILWYELQETREFSCPSCGAALEGLLSSQASSQTCPGCQQSVKLPVVGIVAPPPALPAPFTFNCPGCSALIAAARDQAGKKARCPLCKATILLRIPASPQNTRSPS